MDEERERELINIIMYTKNIIVCALKKMKNADQASSIMYMYVV